jgi:type I restriction enzyme M protein
MNVIGLCRAVGREELKEHEWSLNPGQYVGHAGGEEIGNEDFRQRLASLHEELQLVTDQAREYEKLISTNIAAMIEAE